MLAVGVVAASAGAAAAAPGPASAPPTDPTDPIDVDIDLDQLVDTLTPEQITCIGSQFTPELESDPNAAIEVLTDCGVSMDQLVSLIPGADVIDPVASSEVGSTPDTDDEPDPEAVAAVLAAAGLDAVDITCISAGLDAAVTGDDDEALVILQDCGISLAELLGGLVAVGGDAQGPVADTPVTSSPTGATGDPVTEAVTGMLTSMGIELTDDQISCLTEAVTAGGVNTADTGAIMTLLSECGISLSDMMPSS